MRVQTRPALRVGFILANRFTLSAFASFVDVLRLAADEGDSSRPILCRWNVIAPDMKPIRASCGILIHPDEKLIDPSQFDYLVVVGGLIEHIERLDPRYVVYLKTAVSKRVPLIGLCTGSFILHRAGLMNGYKCCVSWFHRADFLEQFDGLEPVSDRIFIVDRDRISCSGGTSTVHLAAHLVGQHVGVKPARKSLHILMVDEAFDDNKAQPFLPVSFKTKDNLVQRALLIMQQEVESLRTIEQLCRQLGIGRRSLEKKFRTSLGKTPGEALTQIRLEEAKRILSETDATITQTALRCGFFDASHFNKAFQKHTGRTARVYRDENQSSMSKTLD
ncbi:HTH-type transcriptional regulator CdhR [Pseudovibrio axinellae]|uniref:HTH-type transcriptional regulator CdhR n=1 Tax=Pseudovibrio axinellae TaxID=989403 RepID=A0A161V8B1_9HYPH|nr:GlxA family transcriptional regulator [Pseudovibrio axinellae]KZL15418.1 HTH-type transcriptional regulator CdhR [Pseudovibrio axinellae]SER55626.1 transcriptional regulator, AraC family with amidase-like domain [Pseudovibrio axinellae]